MTDRISETDGSDVLVREQIRYYRARAREYDEWFLRQGRYDRGKHLNQQWFAEVEHLRRALALFGPKGHVVELACGTGLWTEQLLDHAERITAVDVAPEVLAINAARVRSDRVRYIEGDVFGWEPCEPADVVFFSFWLSHVPPERFAQFWLLVGSALKPGGRFFFIDSRYNQCSTAKDHRLDDPNAVVVTRRLNDGQEFRIIKVFYERERLRWLLDGLGWSVEIEETSNYFIYGGGLRQTSL